MNGDRYSLVHGEALETLAEFQDGTFDHAIFDPPYSAKVHKAHRIGCTGVTEPTRPNATAAQFNRSKDLGFDALMPALRDGVAVELARIVRRWSIVFTDLEGVGFPRCEELPSGAGWIGAGQRAGLEYVRTMAWWKKGCTPQFTGDRPAMAFECMVLFHRTHPNGKPKKKTWNGGGKHGVYLSEGEAGDLPALDVYTYPIVLNRGKDKVRLHTAQKPLALMEALVADFTDPDDIIVDPFAGSGTTLLAAQRLGRRWLGVEQDESYFNVARTRLLPEVEK